MCECWCVACDRIIQLCDELYWLAIHIFHTQAFTRSIYIHIYMRQLWHIEKWKTKCHASQSNWYQFPEEDFFFFKYFISYNDVIHVRLNRSQPQTMITLFGFGARDIKYFSSVIRKLLLLIATKLMYVYVYASESSGCVCVCICIRTAGVCLRVCMNLCKFNTNMKQSIQDADARSRVHTPIWARLCIFWIHLKYFFFFFSLNGSSYTHSICTHQFHIQSLIHMVLLHILKIKIIIFPVHYLSMREYVLFGSAVSDVFFNIMFHRRTVTATVTTSYQSPFVWQFIITYWNISLCVCVCLCLASMCGHNWLIEIYTHTNSHSWTYIYIYIHIRVHNSYPWSTRTLAPSNARRNFFYKII